MWYQDYSSETQEAQRVRVHPHRPEEKAGNKSEGELRLREAEGEHKKYKYKCSPVKEGGEDDDTQDAEGQDVKDVGQEHLPFTVKTILTLLITDGSQRWDW